MKARARLLGHPIHQMLIVFPLGLLATGVVFDAVYLATDRADMAAVAYWMLTAGIVGGLAAALFGWIDWSAIPRGTRASSVGARHGFGNVIVLALFTGSWLLRGNADAEPGTTAHVLSFAGAALSLMTAWLGGELVDRLGIGVEEGAHPDAPSSLSGRPAAENAGR